MQNCIAPLGKLKILLIEDDELSQGVASNILTNVLHFDYDLAQTGAQALELYGKNKYDIVLTDLGLPDMAGDKLVQAIRKNDANIPIFALTAHDVDDAKKICAKLSMQGFITKPISGAKIAEALGKILNIQAASTHESSHVTPIICDKQILDFDLCKKNADNSAELALELCHKFFKELPGYFHDFQALFATKNLVNLGKLAHKLKGAAIIIGAIKLQTATTKLEDYAYTEKVVHEKIAIAYNQVCAAITELLQLRKDLGRGT